MQKMIGPDQHLDEGDEPVAERLELDGCLRSGVAEAASHDDGDEYPEVELLGETFHGRPSVAPGLVRSGS